MGVKAACLRRVYLEDGSSARGGTSSTWRLMPSVIYYKAQTMGVYPRLAVVSVPWGDWFDFVKP